MDIIDIFYNKTYNKQIINNKLYVQKTINDSYEYIDISSFNKMNIKKVIKWGIEYGYLDFVKHLIDHYLFNKMDILLNEEKHNLISLSIKYYHTNLAIYLIDLYKITKTELLENNNEINFISYVVNNCHNIDFIKYLIDKFSLTQKDISIDIIYVYPKYAKFFIDKLLFIKNDIINIYESVLFEQKKSNENIVSKCFYNYNLIIYLINRFDLTQNDILNSKHYYQNVFISYLYLGKTYTHMIKYFIIKFNMTLNDIFTITTEYSKIIYICIFRNNKKLLNFLIDYYNIQLSNINYDIFQICIQNNNPSLFTYLLKKFNITKNNIINNLFNIITNIIDSNNINLFSMVADIYKINRNNILKYNIDFNKSILQYIIIHNNIKFLLYVIDKFNLTKKDCLPCYILTNNIKILKILSFDIKKIFNYKYDYKKIYNILYNRYNNYININIY